MSSGEVLVTKEDREKLLAYWNEITDILDKYEAYSEYSEWVSTMARVKTAAYGFTTWVNLLSVIEE